MNKNFIIMNKNNNTQMQASSLVKFNFNNKDYLVYFIDENKESFWHLNRSFLYSNDFK